MLLSHYAFARIVAMATIVALAACSSPQKDAGGIEVVATTSTLASFARTVAGDRAKVRALVPIGASPETYAPTPQDIEALARAKVVVENGAGLETWLDRTLSAASNPTSVRVVCTSGLAVRDGNPHLWMDPEFARAYVRAIAAALESADPAGRESYARNAAAYDTQLVALIARTRAAIATIPEARRKMVVFHDAWRYYDARFGIALAGVLELSPGREPSPDHLARLVDTLKRDRIPAVFAEPEYNPKLLRAIGDGAGIHDVAILYDDSIGNDPHTAEYIGMIDTDTATIVRALK